MSNTPNPLSTVKDRYFADLPKDELVSILCEKRKEYFDFLMASGLVEKIARNWEYYHGVYYKNASDRHGTAIKMGGKEGELALISVNHFRSVIQMIITYLLQQPPAWDTMAISNSKRAIEDAKIGNSILDNDMEFKHLDERIYRCCEYAMVLAGGAIKACWDFNSGEPTDGDPETGQIYFSGDMEYEVISPFDYFYDFAHKDFRKIRWIVTRTKKNRWELLEEFPDRRDELLRSMGNNSDNDEHGIDYSLDIEPESTDLVDLWEFFHIPTQALPTGRYLSFVGTTALHDEVARYAHIPVHRLLNAEYLMTSMGYSAAFDYQGPQEGINAEFSTICTNHNNLGSTKVWFREGENINLAELEPGTTIIQSATEPKPLNMTNTPREIFETIKAYIQAMEYLSGINSVARGQPELSLRSGTALAFVDAKAEQFNQAFQKNFYIFLSDLGSGILKCYQRYAQDQRVLAVAGYKSRYSYRTFSAEDLQSVHRVIVKPGNPLMRTIAGRVEVLNTLLNVGLIKTKEEVQTVLETGSLESATDVNDAQLGIVHDENDLLLRGEMVLSAMESDNHVFHIKKHLAVINSVEARMTPGLTDRVMAHVLTHQQFLHDPIALEFQMIMSYEIPPSSMGAPMGGPADIQPPGTGAENPGEFTTPETMKGKAQGEAA